MEWTDDELNLVWLVARNEPFGVLAAPDQLPVAEALRERGILERQLVRNGEGGAEAVYKSTETFRTRAMKLARHQLAAAEAASTN